MRIEGRLPLTGEIVWLTPEQGGRASGPPATPEDHDYAATAFVPPSTATTGLASFVVRVHDRTTSRFFEWSVLAERTDERPAASDHDQTTIRNSA
jgi:hypothetical protein